MLDWKREAADELRNYTNRKAAIENIRDQIADLATEITSIRSASADGSPVAGGSNGRDDALVNNILKRERLEEAQRLTENRVRRVDRALNQLSERDRCVLQRFTSRRVSAASSGCAGNWPSRKRPLTVGRIAHCGILQSQCTASQRRERNVGKNREHFHGNLC